jgi:SAM-dependent methyltransferase
VKSPARDQASFANYFGPRSGQYREARPWYPPALFHFLAIISPTTQLAWDCGTGNGQAAVPLAERFRSVLGTDPSAEMIEQAVKHPRVRYAVARYGTDLKNHSVGLITVAQALHWFEMDQFLAEARRVLVPNGLLAAWCYANCRVTPAVDEAFDHFYSVVLGPYWPRERRHVENGYQSLALPIDEYAVPPFEMAEDWTLAQFLGYVRTWSGVSKCIAARGEEPVLEFERTVADAWGTPGTQRRVCWPLHFRVGEIR